MEVNSFVTGFAVGKKNAKKPVLTELTVTENGVYDEPVIGGEVNIAVGETLTFKESYNVSDIPAEYRPADGEEKKESPLAIDGYFMTMPFVVTNNGVGILLLLGSDFATAKAYIYIDEDTASIYGPMIGSTTPGWYFSPSASMYDAVPCDPPSFVLAEGYIEDQAKAVSFLFSAPPTPADGWNKVTVNVPTGVELNIAYGDTPPEDTTKMWCKTSQADGVDILPVDRFDSLPELSKSIVIGATVVVDNKIYIVSPGTSNSSYGDGKIWCYDTETKELLPDTFKTRARGGHSAWYCNGKLYSFGGSTENTYYGNTVTMTKLSDGTKSELSLSFDGYTYGMAMGMIGEKVYLLGGSKDSESGSGSTRIACFDCGTDTIAPIEAVLPSGRVGAGYVTHGDKIYVIGGAANNYIGKTTIYRFDMVTHDVETMAYLPKKLFKPVCALFGDEIYIMYGTEKINASASEVANDSIYVYNILENTVKEFPQKNAEDMYRPPLSAHADQFYLIGGGKGRLMSATNQVNTFRPYPVSRPDCLAVETADAGVPFTVFIGQNNVRCPVSGVFKGNIDGTADPVETAIYNGDEWETI